MSAEKQQMLQRFLRALGLKPSTKFKLNLSTQLHSYRLDHDPSTNTLWRLRHRSHSKDRKVVLEDLIFDTIPTVHGRHAPLGKNKTFDLIRTASYGITKEEVSLIHGF